LSTIYTSYQEYSAYWELNNSPRQLQAFCGGYMLTK
jgi:hypothetical protein